MSIVYMLSLVILFITMVLVKKSEKKLDILVWIAIIIALLICYQTFISYIYTMLNIPINLINLTLGNLVVIIGLWCINFKSKKIQNYEIHKKDFCAISVILLVVFIVVLFQYGIPLNIKYMMTDSSVHYLAAREFYEQDCLLLKAGSTETYKCMMPGAYTNIGILFKTFAPLIGEMNLYKVFISFDIFMLILGGILIYLTIRKVAPNRLQFGLAIGVSVLYILGYPLNSVLSGYSYLTIGIIIISTILLFMKSFKYCEIKSLVSIIVLFLLCMQIFFSYYLFMPVVYGTLGIYYIIYFKQKHKKFWNRRDDSVCYYNFNYSSYNWIYIFNTSRDDFY